MSALAPGSLAGGGGTGGGAAARSHGRRSAGFPPGLAGNSPNRGRTRTPCAGRRPARGAAVRRPAGRGAGSALLPQPRRRIVLATNVAETSVTVEGISGVVDTGLARIMSFDPDLGLDRLELMPIARDSAEQRAGRGPAAARHLRTPVERSVASAAARADGARGAARRPGGGSLAATLPRRNGFAALPVAGAAAGGGGRAGARLAPPSGCGCGANRDDAWVPAGGAAGASASGTDAGRGAWSRPSRTRGAGSRTTFGARSVRR